MDLLPSTPPTPIGTATSSIIRTRRPRLSRKFLEETLAGVIWWSPSTPNPSNATKEHLVHETELLLSQIKTEDLHPHHLFLHSVLYNLSRLVDTLNSDLDDYYASEDSAHLRSWGLDGNAGGFDNSACAQLRVVLSIAIIVRDRLLAIALGSPSTQARVPPHRENLGQESYYILYDNKKAQNFTRTSVSSICQGVARAHSDVDPTSPWIPADTPVSNGEYCSAVFRNQSMAQQSCSGMAALIGLMLDYHSLNMVGIVRHIYLASSF